MLMLMKMDIFIMYTSVVVIIVSNYTKFIITKHIMHFLLGSECVKLAGHSDYIKDIECEQWKV